jgi:hypothetical protein
MKDHCIVTATVIQVTPLSSRRRVTNTITELTFHLQVIHHPTCSNLMVLAENGRKQFLLLALTDGYTLSLQKIIIMAQKSCSAICKTQMISSR